MATKTGVFIRVLAVLLVHLMNYTTNAGKQKEYTGIQETPAENEIVGDGNCFYRSISFYLYGHQENYHEIRREIIQYMSEREHEYSQLMYDRSQNYEGYLEHHRNDEVWAEHPMIYAAADRYGMNIYVTSARYSGNHLYIATSEHSSVDQSRWLHLRHENNHYNIIGRG